MNYEDMSDWEVTKRVVEIKCAGQDIEILPQRDFMSPIESGVMENSVYLITESGREQKVNCCNEPSDAWPIIVSNEISITSLGYGKWEVINSSGEFYCKDEFNNPLRAAMICFLKMKDEEK